MFRILTLILLLVSSLGAQSLLDLNRQARTSVVTVGTLPGSPVTGQIAVVSDGTTGDPCGTGSGSVVAICRYNGSSWDFVGVQSGGLSAPAGNGIVVWNGSGTLNRTLTGDSEIVVANGDGVSGNPTLSIASSLTRDSEVNVQGTSNEIASTGSGVAPTLSIASTFRITGKDATAPVKTGTSTPATCTVGDLFFDTDATAGLNVFGCTATNTWTLIGDGAPTAPGSDTEVVFNSSGNFGASAEFTYNGGNLLTLGDNSTSSTYTIRGSPSGAAGDSDIDFVDGGFVFDIDLGSLSWGSSDFDLLNDANNDVVGDFRLDRRKAGGPVLDGSGIYNIVWQAHNSASASHIFAELTTEVSDNTDTTEDTIFRIKTSIAGTSTERLEFNPTGIELDGNLISPTSGADNIVQADGSGKITPGYIDNTFFETGWCYSVPDDATVGYTDHMIIPSAGTITEIKSGTESGTFDFNVEERTAINASGTDAMSSDQQAAAGDTSTTSFSNAAFAVGWASIVVSAVSSPVNGSACVVFRFDP